MKGACPNRRAANSGPEQARNERKTSILPIGNLRMQMLDDKPPQHGRQSVEISSKHNIAALLNYTSLDIEAYTGMGMGSNRCPYEHAVSKIYI